jgi:hypothetical protein
MGNATPGRQMAAMLPWLVLPELIQTAAFSLVPFIRGREPAGGGTLLQTQLDAAFSPFQICGRSVNRGTLLKLAGRDLTGDLVALEENGPRLEPIDDAFEFAEVAAFAGLASRDFTLPADAGYCNRSDFALFVQQFVGMPDGAATVRRRRHTEGTGVLVVGEVYHVSIPPAASRNQPTPLDRPLLRALVSARGQASWQERVWEGIWQFNHANTDSDDIRPQMECVMMVSAFERLLGCESGHEAELADAFIHTLVPAAPISWESSPRRASKPKVAGSLPVRQIWIRDFFQRRGHSAHGRLSTPSGHDLAWDLDEHLLLGAIAFPLTLKCVLMREGLYTLTADDRRCIDAFEALASHSGPINGSAISKVMADWRLRELPGWLRTAPPCAGGRASEED